MFDDKKYEFITEEELKIRKGEGKSSDEKVEEALNQTKSPEAEEFTNEFTLESQAKENGKGSQSSTQNEILDDATSTDLDSMGEEIDDISDQFDEDVEEFDNEEELDQLSDQDVQNEQYDGQEQVDDQGSRREQRRPQEQSKEEQEKTKKEQKKPREEQENREDHDGLNKDQRQKGDQNHQDQGSQGRGQNGPKNELESNPNNTLPDKNQLGDHGEPNVGDDHKGVKKGDKKPELEDKTKGNSSMDRGRKNMELRNRMRNGAGEADAGNPIKNNPATGAKKKLFGASGSPVKGATETASNAGKATGAAAKGAGKAAGTTAKGAGKAAGSAAKGAGKTAAKGAKAVAHGLATAAKAIAAFIAAHPWVLIILFGILLIMLIILVFADEDYNNKYGGAGGGSPHCSYNLSGVTSQGTQEFNNLQVELVNCDATEGNSTVLATVDFEKYVLGVALAEVGSGSPDEAIKAQIIAVRNFSLTRNSGMCPGNPDDCFYGYNASTGKIRMRACEADQVYWDYKTDIYRSDRGAISLYSPEVDSSTGTLWHARLTEEQIKHVESLANEVKGKVLLDASGQVLKVNYNSTTSNEFINGANSGKNYEEILNAAYGTKEMSTAECNSTGNIDYGDYVLDTSNATILHEPLDQFLASHGTSLEAFNNKIANNVNDAGYGTRAGVVVAAVTLLAELSNNYNVKVPYFWGGGHADGVVIGALGYWGSDECHAYANNQNYEYCGLDCSGFVPWAIKNGGYTGMYQWSAGKFYTLPGAQKVSLNKSGPVLQPGDLLESSGHIVLVVAIEDHGYLCAEASGNSKGVQFTHRSFADADYWGVDMTGYYGG